MEHVLVGLIVILAIWGIGVQVMIHHVVKEEQSFSEGDEERLAAEISKIEEELVAQYTVQQIDVWAPNEGSDSNTTEADEETIDPNQAWSPDLITRLATALPTTWLPYYTA